MKFFTFHIGDWVTATSDLSPSEEHLYFKLLLKCYSEESGLMRTQCERIANALRLDGTKELDYVLDTFFYIDDDGLYHNKRAENEIAKQNEKSEKARKSALSKKKRTNSERIANDERTLNERTANGVLTNNHNIYINNKEKENKEKEKNSGFSQISCADSLSISPEEIESINHDLNYLTKTETENDIPVFGVPSTTEESEKQKKPKAKKEKTSLCGVRKPEGLDDKTWSDYLKIRKGKLSDRGMHDIEIQASKAGLTTAQAIEFSVRKGWIGFNANWYNSALSSENRTSDETVSEKAKRIAQAIGGN